MEAQATIEGLRQFLIHSEPYIEIYYSLMDDPDTIHQTRLGSADLPEGLKVGDRVTIISVLGVVAAIHKVEADESS